MAALDHQRPAVVLYDIGGMAGPVAAERWGVPAAQLSPSIVAWDGYHDDMAAALAPMLSTPSTSHTARHSTTGWPTRSCRSTT